MQNYREATHAVCEVDFRTKHASLVESIKDFPLGRIEHVTVEVTRLSRSSSALRV